MNNKLTHQIASGVILIFIGITLMLSNYISDKREEVFSNMNLVLSEEKLKEQEEKKKNEEKKQQKEENSIEINEEEAPNDEETYETYAGTLEIPKIGFYKGFYNKYSTLNDVKFNIKILDISDYPDKEKGNVIIIGHSGNYSNSYFANLYMLSNGDTASITYNNKKYTYQINNIYTDIKDGSVTIYRDQNRSTLTLITCTKDDETRQTIYIMYLINVE